MNFPSYIDSPFCVRLVITFGHFLWQATAIAFLAGLAMGFLRKASSQLRYSLWVLTLFIMVACPIATFPLVSASPALSPLMGGAAAQSHPGAGTAPTLTVPDDVVPGLPGGQAADVGPKAPAVVAAMPLMQDLDRKEPGVWGRIQLREFAPYLAILYFIGVSLMLVRLAFGLHGGRRLRWASEPVDDSALLGAVTRRAKAVGLRLTPAVAFCSRVAVPTVIGVMRPMILLPVSLATGLTTEQIEAVLTHELAHIRRYDHLLNLMQRVIESLLFFHPAVWFVSRRIRAERENCCDDLAVASCGERTSYAESLLRMAQLCFARPVSRHAARVTMLQAADRPSPLRLRIIRLFGSAAHEQIRLRRSWPVVLALLVSVLVAASLLVNAGAEMGKPEDSIKPESSSQWKATLPNGVTVELVGVSYHPSEGKPWWRPDGSPLEELPCAKVSVPPEEDFKGYQFVGRISAPPGARQVSTRYHFEPRVRNVTGVPVTSENATVDANLGIRTDAFPKGTRSATLVITVSTENQSDQSILFRNVSLERGHSTDVKMIQVVDIGKVAVTPKLLDPEEERLAFGPVIERVVNDDHVSKDIFIDFDTARLFSPPAAIDSRDGKAGMEWIEKAGIDALCETNVDVRGLACFDMIAIPVRSERWDAIKPEGLQKSLGWGKIGSPVFMSGKGELPTTYIFKTREGGMGILQIVGFTEDPRGVSIRYKMVARSQATAAPARLTGEP